MKTLLSAALIAATTLCGSVQAAEISVAANSTGKNLDFLRKLFVEFEEKSGHKVSLVTMPPSSSEQFAQYRLWLAAGNKDVDVYQTDVVWAPQLADQFIDLKAAAGETASLLFQDGYSGRAEIGLAGDDDLHCKVSADGSAWAEALTVERSTGEVSLPATPWASGGNLLLNGDWQINQRGFAGGALAAGVYGCDRWKAGPAGATLSLAGYDLTLSAGALVQPVEPALWGLSSFAGQPLTLSVEGLPGGALSVSVGSVSGSIAAGAGRRSVTLTPAAGDTGALLVSLAPVGPAVSLRRVKLEIGRRASTWAARPATLEELLCARYFWRPESSLALDAYQAAGGAVAQTLILPTRMRATPSAAFAVSGTVNVAGGSPALTVLSRREARVSVAASGVGRVQATFGSIAFDAEL